MFTIDAQPELTTLVAKPKTKDLLRFITCGNVDDGKSTLIGRLLLESGAIYDDQIEALRRESAKHGTAGEKIDPALLLDGLEDERQQGITIDVAYRYFSTADRKFIIADTPGHEQFTRNMATGASTADLAVILVDATKGVSTQTKRHAFIVSLLGIKQIVLAVNKMDLRDFQQSVFDQICEDFASFAQQLPLDDVYPIPASALDGDNVVAKSDRTPWYSGRTLAEQLHAAPIKMNTQSTALRLPIQWVNRPDPSFRGFSGTVASGTVHVGDEVTILPSGKSSRIARIVTMDGDLERADAEDSITVTLADEIDITRGDMLVSPEQLPHVNHIVEANLLWMSDAALVPGKQYWFKHTTRRTSCEIQSIAYGIDINTLDKSPSASLGLNEIGHGRLKLHDPIVFDDYQQNRQTGSFILVDRVTHETLAAGMLTVERGDPGTAGNWSGSAAMTWPQAAKSKIPQQDRQLRFGHPPLTILVTGLSGSGKTSVALELERQLFERGDTAIVLDGQTLRLGLNRDLGFSAEERSENLRRASEIAKLINDSGQICIAAFVAPSAWVREKARELIGPTRFVHVHLSTPVEVCRRRDISGQYLAADRGEIASFPGVTFQYEPASDADMTFDTSLLAAEDIAGQVLRGLRELPGWA